MIDNQSLLPRFQKPDIALVGLLLTGIVEAVEFKDEKKKKQAQFFTRQYVNSLSPSNFVLTNPEVCKEVLKSKGQNMRLD